MHTDRYMYVHCMHIHIAGASLEEPRLKNREERSGH